MERNAVSGRNDSNVAPMGSDDGLHMRRSIDPWAGRGRGVSPGGGAGGAGGGGGPGGGGGGAKAWGA